MERLPNTGMYPEGTYDLAGFCVGAAERGTADAGQPKVGDITIALRSSGIHSTVFHWFKKSLKFQVSPSMHQPHLKVTLITLALH